jgi:hypothetical protein
LVLVHHDPELVDPAVDVLLRDACDYAGRHEAGLDIVGARDGLRLEL